MNTEKLDAYVRESFANAGLVSIAALRDDEKVKRVAQMAYKAMPLPLRAVCRMALGKGSFERYALMVRDKMIEKEPPQ